MLARSSNQAHLKCVCDRFMRKTALPVRLCRHSPDPSRCPNGDPTSKNYPSTFVLWDLDAAWCDDVLVTFITKMLLCKQHSAAGGKAGGFPLFSPQCRRQIHSFIYCILQLEHVKPAVTDGPNAVFWYLNLIISIFCTLYLYTTFKIEILHF